MIWIGTSASPQLLLDLFGVDDLVQVDPRMVSHFAMRSNVNLISFSHKCHI